MIKKIIEKYKEYSPECINSSEIKSLSKDMMKIISIKNNYGKVPNTDKAKGIYSKLIKLNTKIFSLYPELILKWKDIAIGDVNPIIDKYPEVEKLDELLESYFYIL